jgi:hypothetical protein
VSINVNVVADVLPDMETAEEEFQDLVLDDLDDWKRQRERSGGTVPDLGQTDAAL